MTKQVKKKGLLVTGENFVDVGLGQIRPYVPLPGEKVERGEAGNNLYMPLRMVERVNVPDDSVAAGLRDMVFEHTHVEERQARNGQRYVIITVCFVRHTALDDRQMELPLGD
jgi:hypothetical protein